MNLSRLERLLGYQFKDQRLLVQALTHRSHSATHNERFEFLGDSILNFTVAAILFHRLQREDEGDLSRIRASLVKQATLADIAHRLELPQFLRLGEGELKSGGFRRPSILADALEAIFAAVYLDSDVPSVQAVIEGLYTPLLDSVDFNTLGKDAKTLLQEVLQGASLPCLSITSSLPAVLLTTSSSRLNALLRSWICAARPVAAAVAQPNRLPRAKCWMPWKRCCPKAVPKSGCARLHN